MDLVDQLNQVDHENWLSRLKHDSPQRDRALAELRSYLVRGLTRSLLHRYGGKVQIEDVVQVALLQILKSLPSFRGQSRFETWAMAIAIRIGISELRRNYYRDVSLDAMAESDPIQLQITDPTDAAEENRGEQQRYMQLLQKFLDESLTNRQRLALRASLEGLPTEEIARRIGSNRNAVYKLLHDARLRLRQEFERLGITAEDIRSAHS